jgi:pimeloyl-ACP methyl ester carboxylesterase
MSSPAPDRSAATSTFAHAPGECLHCRIVGSGARPVLLLHGFAASQHTWDDLIPLFPPEEFTLHLLDLKGHGGSDKPADGDYSALHNARIITAYIRSRGLSDVVIIGHSFGGVVGLLTAMGCPDVTRLILIGTPGLPQEIPFFMRILRIPFIGPLLMSSIPAENIALRGLEAAFHRHERITRRLVERYAELYRISGAARALSNTVQQIVPHDMEKIISRYRALAIPVLLLWGEHDRVVGVWQGERLHSALRHSRLAIIPDCGHNPHEERPEEAFTHIREFLSHRS